MCIVIENNNLLKFKVLGKDENNKDRCKKLIKCKLQKYHIHDQWIVDAEQIIFEIYAMW